MTAGDASVLANVRLDGDRTVDIVIRDGRIEEIAPDLAEATPAATRIEGGTHRLAGILAGCLLLVVFLSKRWRAPRPPLPVLPAARLADPVRASTSPHAPL